jgi:hypothetical protein
MTKKEFLKLTEAAPDHANVCISILTSPLLPNPSLYDLDAQDIELRDLDTETPEIHINISGIEWPSW